MKSARRKIRSPTRSRRSGAGMSEVRATRAASEAGDRSANALERLASLLAQGDRTMPRTCVSGAVTEIAISHYRVAGLSRFVRLGECVRLDVGDRSQIGEVVRIEDGAITLKPFDSRCDTAIGARAYRAESLIALAARRVEGAGDRRAGPADRRRRRTEAGRSMLCRSTPNRRRRCGARGFASRSRPAFA